MFKIGDKVRCNCGCRGEGIVKSKKTPLNGFISIRWTKTLTGISNVCLKDLTKIGSGNPNNKIIIKNV